MTGKNKMNKTEKTVRIEKSDDPFPLNDEDIEFSDTARLVKKKYTGLIPIKRSTYIKIILPNKHNKIIELGDSLLTLGRSPECSIQLSLPNISRKHTSLFFSNDEYHIEDLDSTNGTYVNGIKVVNCVLRDKDQIDIGSAKIIFYE